jgi:hypothetical protein
VTDAYRDYVERRRVAERTLAAERALAATRPRPAPERKGNGWAAFWTISVLVWLVVTAAFVAADPSDPESGDVLAPILVGWTFWWLFCALALAFIGLELTDPAPSPPNQNQLLATQNTLIAEQNRLLAGRRGHARPAPAPRYRPLPREGYGLHGHLSTLKRRA